MVWAGSAAKTPLPLVAASLWGPAQAAGWDAQVRVDSHVSPLHCGHAWVGCWGEQPRQQRLAWVQHSDDALLAFQQVNNGQRAYWWPLDEGMGTSVLLGQRPVEALHALLQQYALPLPWSLRLGQLLQGSPLHRQLHAAFAAQGIARLEEQAVGQVYCASLRGGLDGWLSRRSPRFRKNLAREQRRADATGLRFVRIRPQTRVGADAAMARMLAVEQSSWKADEEGSYSLGHYRQRYGRLLQRLAAAGQARIVLAQWQGRDVGFLLGGVVGGVFAGLHFGYDQRMAGMGVGNLLQWQAVQWLCAEGVQRYDLGMGGAGRLAYKPHWAEQALPVAHLWLHRK